MHWCKIYDIIIKQPNDAVFSGSCRGHADVAQLAEQLICNQQVIGSSPIIGLTLLKRNFNIAGWSSLEARRAHNPKVVGSNPAPATYIGNS